MTYMYLICDVCIVPVCRQTHLQRHHVRMQETGREVVEQPVAMRTRSQLSRNNAVGYSGDEEEAQRSEPTTSSSDIQGTESSGDMPRRSHPPKHRRKKRGTREVSPQPSTSGLNPANRDNSPQPGPSGMHLRMPRSPRAKPDSPDSESS